MPKLPPKIMNNEINKYPIFALTPEGTLEDVSSIINSTDDYNHYLAELHHFVPYTDWEMNTKNVKNIVEQKLILLPKACHQHLENSDFRMPKDEFEKVYKINPEHLLFDINRKDFQVIPAKLKKYELEYDGCFDDIDHDEVMKCLN
ncbi:MAG: hypothetical protein PHV37_09130 [Candidatus Gastranaerophilales bacterium]|nr:hypothetical protein [Candidatus Gastranaerophilales bacterium]